MGYVGPVDGISVDDIRSRGEILQDKPLDRLPQFSPKIADRLVRRHLAGDLMRNKSRPIGLVSGSCTPIGPYLNHLRV
jgi:hypothetical protein